MPRDNLTREGKKDVYKFNLRMSKSLADQLGEAAFGNNRSLNAEIVQRLRASLEGYRR